jgi:carbohydrate kinase (thermoresistant glucokinase family)
MTERAIVVMGVSGSGKSTVGQRLAQRIGAVFLDADDLHSAASKAKMAAGTPLTDDDRMPWLQAIAERLAKAQDDRGVVVACSALRRTYRDVLRAERAVPVVFVHLDGEASLLESRLRNREGHFMPPTLLASQLSTLEALAPDEVGFTIPLDTSVDEIVAQIARGLVAQADTPGQDA